MSHLSQNLERLIQMISIEQLLGLVKQNNTSSDILTTPIVQKVVKAYEDELQTLNTVTNPNSCVKDYSEDIAKIHEQLAAINSNLLHLADAIKNIHIRTNVGLSYSEAKVTNEVVTNEDKSLEDKSSLASLEEEHVRLKIEEKQVTTVNESDDESSLASSSVAEEEEEEEEEVEEAEEEEEAEDLEEEVEEAEEVDELEEEEEEVEEASVADEVESEEVEEESEKEISDEESEEEEVEDLEVEDLEVEVLSEAKSSNAVEEEDEEEVFEIEIDDVTYYATSEENGILYEVDADGEVGKKVGIIKDGEPIFL